MLTRAETANSSDEIPVWGSAGVLVEATAKLRKALPKLHTTWSRCISEFFTLSRCIQLVQVGVPREVAIVDMKI